jgi:hypothetical protein
MRRALLGAEVEGRTSRLLQSSGPRFDTFGSTWLIPLTLP